jgi:hypoxanthine phosphoribosyltransferase
MNTVNSIHHLIPLVCVNHTLICNVDAYGNWVEGYQTDPAQIVTEDMVTQVFTKMATEIKTKTWGLHDRNRVCFISILKGGLYTQYRLLQLLPQTALFVGHIGRSSYRKRTVASKLKATYDLDLTPKIIQGALVWLIDDIADTGSTIQSAYKAIEQYHPKKIMIATLVNKGWKNLLANIDVCGFNVEHKYDPFIVGCGMGLEEVYRNGSSLYEVQFERNDRCS